MQVFSRRDFVASGLAGVGLTLARGPLIWGGEADSGIQDQLLAWASLAERERKARYAAVGSVSELEALQTELRSKFVRLIGGLPKSSTPPNATHCGQIEADDYLLDKLVFESFPGYFVSALLYRPKKGNGRCPAVISPCGHSPVGKAADSYQILHINLVRQGYVVLTYDPVGQGERSQFWDVDQHKSRFNLVCGEHAVLGNPLYLLGSSLARYRIWDGIRGLDYLASLPEVDPRRMACVGNSGGGTMTAYLAALDARVSVAAICCYITTLPRRMGNRIEADPDADPEQDIFDFVGSGIDHAGLLAMRAPKPTLLGCAQRDFFPIEGARASFAEAQQLFKLANAHDRIAKVEADAKHGLTLPLREGIYQWFGRWLRNKDEKVTEFPVVPRPNHELQVCREGQVNVSFGSRHLLELALDEFHKSPMQSRNKPERETLRKLLNLDSASANVELTEICKPEKGSLTLLLINGNESRDWRDEMAFLKAIKLTGYAVVVVDPRGIGKRRYGNSIPQKDYIDPLTGAEENLAYNAFLLGRSLLGMRVADVLQAVQLVSKRPTGQRVVLCGRGDAAMVACLSAALELNVHAVAMESLLLNHEMLFQKDVKPVNAASILPGLLKSFGDTADILSLIGPRKVLVCEGIGKRSHSSDSAQFLDGTLIENFEEFGRWLR